MQFPQASVFRDGIGSCLRRESMVRRNRSQGQSVWSECLQSGWILRHGVGRTTVFWSARGRAQRRRHFGPARRGKPTHSQSSSPSRPLHAVRNRQRGHLRIFNEWQWRRTVPVNSSVTRSQRAPAQSFLQAQHEHGPSLESRQIGIGFNQVGRLVGAEFDRV